MITQNNKRNKKIKDKLEKKKKIKKDKYISNSGSEDDRKKKR